MIRITLDDRKHSRAGVLCTTLGALLATPALSAEETTHVTLEEIIVTATKRAERLQDVPISIKALTGEVLTDMGADSFTDFARQVPSLMFAERGSGRNQIVIRGLSPVIGVPTVGYYLDGISTEIPFESPDPKLFDIERIEILRGPQGTLYGAGAVGGLIHVITRNADPSGWDAAAEVEYSDTRHGGDSSGVNAMLNMPLVKDKLALRVVGVQRDTAGWVDAPLIGAEDANDEETKGMRASLTWVASEDFEATLKYYYQDIEFGIDSFDSPSQAEAAGFANRGVSAVSVPVSYENEANQVSLDLRWSLGAADLEWVTGHNTTETHNVVDIIPLAGVAGPLENEYDFTTSELRLVSTAESDWQWVAGIYYKKTERDVFADFNTFLLPVAGFGQTIVVHEDKEMTALFGELTRHFAERWSVTLGARYYQEDYDSDSVTSTFIDGVPGPVLVEEGAQSGDDKPFTPKIGLDYKVNDDLLYYAVVGKGVRSGGVNIDLAGDPNFQPTYESDSAWSYEIGMKSQWAERRVTFNAALFHVDWRNLQIDGIPGESSTGFITNGGKAHTRGVEMDFEARPTENWLFNLGAAWVEAETDEEFQGPEGQRLPNVPRYTANAGVEYSFPLGSLQGSLRADYSYRDGSYGDLPNRGSGDPLSNYSGSYGLANARFGIDGSRWSVVAYCDNLADSDGSSFSFLDPEGIDQVYRVRPRTYGIKATVRLK
jgi:iron complex outermembrane receptor protein